MSQVQEGAAANHTSGLRTFMAFVATGSLLFGVYKYCEAANQKKILEFQQAEVSWMIAEHGRDGVKISTLQYEYDREAKRAKLPADKLGDDQLELIILNLVDKHAITRVGKDRVRMLSESDLCGSHNAAFDVYNQRSPKALALLTKNNGRLTVPQVYELFRDQFELKDGEEESLFGDLVTSQRVGVSPKTQRVWNLLSRADMKPECFPPQPLVIVPQRMPPVETTFAPSTPPPAAESYASTPPPADVYQGIFRPPQQRYRRVAARPTEATPAWVRE